jgi:glycerol-3-phosphate dehydrogenase
MMKTEQISETADVLILGAGINGCGIAAELSHSGLRVIVLEKNTIGSGTSSKSSRLIHGGLRYLEQFQLTLVHEALQDRQELLEKYPDLVQMKPFYLPIYRSSPRPAWMIWSGLKLYSLLARRHGKYRSRIVSKTRFRTIAPRLRQEGLKAVFQYYDAKTNDLELTRRVAAEAQENGAAIHQFTVIKSIHFSDSAFQLTTNRGRFSAPTLINATGPWIDEINQTFHLPSRYHIRKISGIHVIFKGLITRNLMFMQTRGKRIFFIIPEPEHDYTIIGTTEREESGSMDSIQINPEDVDYLLHQLNEYLEPDWQVTPDDIKTSYIGVRPLIAQQTNPTDLSRDYVLDLHETGSTRLLHVFGGKLTTYLSLARKVRKLLD